MAKHAAQPRAATNLPHGLFLRRLLVHNRPIPEPLMGPLRVVVLDVLSKEVVEMVLSEHQEVIEALDLQRLSGGSATTSGVRSLRALSEKLGNQSCTGSSKVGHRKRRTDG
jgi:hypothetical protein